MTRAGRLAAVFWFAFAVFLCAGSGCRPYGVCEQTEGACLDLELRGEGRASSVTLELLTDNGDGTLQTKKARALADVELPTHLLVTPPPGISEALVRSARVTTFDAASLPERSGMTAISWPVGAHLEASIELQTYRKPDELPTTVDLRLASLSVSAGSLSPAFSPSQNLYTVQPPSQTSLIELAAQPMDPRATVLINTMLPATAGAAVSVRLSPTQSLSVPIVVMDRDGHSQVYAVNFLTRPSAYIKASNTSAADGFSYGMALSGNTLVVGAPREDSSAGGINGNQLDDSAANSGAVYVFTLSGTTWAQQAYLKAAMPTAGDNFGYSVAIDGDTIVVGAPGEDSAATGVNGSQSDESLLQSGAAYVFQRSGATWTQQAYLKASNSGANDNFGHSVAISRDTVAVGAISEDSSATGVNGNSADNGATDSGAVYVFQRAGATWAQQAYVKPSNTGANDAFGVSIALDLDKLAVGAVFEDSSATGVNGDGADNGATDSGAAYVFQRVGTTWFQQAYIKATNTNAGDSFGNAVALSTGILAVGAPTEDSAASGINGSQANNLATDSGAVYVYISSNGVWMPHAYVKASNPTYNGSFGVHVALVDRLLVVGSPGENSAATGLNGNETNTSAFESGAAYAFELSTKLTWSQSGYLKASNTGANDDFGLRVAATSDTIAVGAIFEASAATGINGDQSSNGQPDSGAIYVFR